MTEQSLAIFDFDGTLTKQDSFYAFIRYYKSPFRFYLGYIILFPFLLLYKLRITSNSWTKQIILKYFFRNTPVEEFRSKCERFSFTVLPGMLKREGLERVKWHQNQQHTIVIVTATIDLWLEHWCQKLNIQLIATGMEVKNGRISGRLSTPNCFGAEKLRRIMEKFDLKEFKRIYAYGDSNADRDMLAIANEKYYRLFKQ